MVATNLSIALRKEGKSIALVDGKLQFGDIAVALDLRTSVTIKDVAEEIDTIDSSQISNYLFAHVSGVHVLPAPDRIEYGELITKEIMTKTITMLRQHYDYVIIDCGYAFHEMTIEMLDMAEKILVITTVEMIAVKNTKQLIDIFSRLEYIDKTKLIVNRYDAESLIKAEDVPTMLYMNEAENISNDTKFISQSLNIGIPIVSYRSRSNAARDLFKLAGKLISDFPVEKIEDKTKKT